MDSMLLSSVLIVTITLAITVLLERKLVPYLRGRASQPIYADGPVWHMSKSGTPTMGGLGFLASINLSLGIICLLLMSDNESFNYGLSILISLIYSSANALIGIFDDLMKLKRKQNGGLTPTQKILLQLLLAILFLMAREYFFKDNTILQFTFGSIDIGILYYPFAIILLLGVVNCANLSDGIDGLASSVAVSIGGVFLTLSLIASIPEVTILSSALIGGACGFLIFNKHPAKIFMGDTGSLFLGALAVCLSFSSGNPLLIIAIGGVYVIEGVSVILQVIYFKLTKKRLFKMAPLHHHLEKCGYSENKICLIAIAATLGFSALSFLLFKV